MSLLETAVIREREHCIVISTCRTPHRPGLRSCSAPGTWRERKTLVVSAVTCGREGKVRNTSLCLQTSLSHLNLSTSVQLLIWPSYLLVLFTSVIAILCFIWMCVIFHVSLCHYVLCLCFSDKTITWLHSQPPSQPGP